MTDYLEKEDAAHVLDVQILAESLRGNGIATGCVPSEGTGSMEIDVTDGRVIIDNSETEVTSGTVTLSAGGTDPRFDVVYVDTNGDIQIAEGTEGEAEHTGDGNTTFADDPFEYGTPAPPDLSDFSGIPLAIIPVPAGAPDYDILRDIRLSTELILEGVNFLSEMTLPEYDETDNAPEDRGNLIYVTGTGSDDEGTYVHNGTNFVSIVSEVNLTDINIDGVLDMGDNNITNVSTVEISDTLRVEQGRGSYNLPEHHVRYGTGLSESEISRRSLDADEKFEVWLLDINLRGGGTDNDFTVRIYDEDDNTVLAETSDIVRGGSTPVGTSTAGADVTVQVTNNTGDTVDATISGQIYRVQD